MNRSLKITMFLLYSLNIAWAAPPADPEAAFRKALGAMAAKDYSTGLKLFEESISADPDNLRYASEYRQAVIQAKEFDRSIQFFEKLTMGHPASGHAFLNFGFAYVDKIPVTGSITQVILANNALAQFSKAIELQPEWIAYYTRGNAYLFWPKVFGRTSLGIADLEQALKIQKREPKRSYHVRTYISLGDGYWRMDNAPRARAVWREGLKKFPESQPLNLRLARQGGELKGLIEAAYDSTQRVDTNLRNLWADQ